VYPDVLLLEHRQSKVGDVEQMLVGKFASTNDSKQSCAQVGTKLANSGDRVIDAALACVENAYARRSRLGQHNAILGGAA